MQKGGQAIFTPGNTITATQNGVAVVTVHHTEAWGGGTQELRIPSGTLSLTARFDNWDPDYPTRLWFTVVSLAAELPSFSSVALDGDMTGDNVFSGRQDAGRGYIDTSTYAIDANVYAKFFNDVFVGEPAIVQAKIRGTFDPTTHTARLDFEAGTFRVIA